MPRQLSISFHGPAGEMEGVMALPTIGAPPWPAVAVCHADPLMGGSMTSPVIEWVCRHLNETAIATLRFNFRGVGASEGVYSGGRGEREDAYAAFQLLQEWPETDPDRLGVAGYSFGATMALLAGLREPAVQAVALISPPLGLLEYQGLFSYQKPLLVIGGGKDLMVPGEKLTALGPQLPARAETVVIPQADRSWAGKEAELGVAVARFFKGALRGE